MLAGDWFMPKLQGFTDSTCALFTKHLGRIPKLKKTSDWKYIRKNELDKACFAHDVEYSDSKYLDKRTISDKILKERAYEMTTNPNYNEYQIELTSVIYRLFDKKTGSGANVNKC